MEIQEINKIDDLLIKKLKENFNENEQQMFMQSFSKYLRYNPEKDYIIDLDDVYEWIGFNKKGDCKKLLIKYFKEHIDYKINIDNSDKVSLIPASAIREAGSSIKNLGGSGKNKETILMNIKTFKKLCMRASTKKADEIHDYYYKMEVILQSYIDENTESEKKQIKETTLLESYHNKKVLYLVWIDQFLLKFGWSDNINQRILDHKKTYGEQSKLIYVTECTQNKLLETHMKQHNDINSCIVSKVFNNRNRTELLDINKITVNQIIKIIEFLKDKLLQDFEIFQMQHNERIKELENKQKELDNVKYIEETKRKELDFQLEKMKCELEMYKLKLQYSVDPTIQEVIPEIIIPEVIIQEVTINQRIEMESNVIREYFELCTVYSNKRSDTISMINLYKKFIIWINIKYPELAFGQREFTHKFNKLKLTEYYDKISELNGTSGIRYRNTI